MTYQDFIEAKRVQKIGFYVEFNGIQNKFSTHDFSVLGLPGDYIPCILDGTISNISNKLDREFSFVEPAGCSFQCGDSSEIRNVLRRRGGRESSLKADVSDYDSTITTDDTSFSIGDFVYLDKETLEVTSGYSSGGYTVERAKFDSFARSHRQGAILSTAPRHWLSRHCRLYAVDLEGLSTQLLGSYILSDSPRFEDGIWSISMADLLSTLNRPIYKGWQEQKALSVSDNQTIVGAGVIHSNVVEIEVEDATNFVLHYNNYAHVKISFGDYWAVFNLLGLDSLDIVGNIIKVAFSHIIAHNFGAEYNVSDFKRRLVESDDVELKQVIYYRGTLRNLALVVLHSRYGDQSNAFYDKWGGRPPAYKLGSINNSEKRLGAGIEQNLIDLNSILDISLDKITLFIEEEMRLIDLFSQEILWRSGGYLYLNQEGKIAFKKYAPLSIRSTANTVNKDLILQATINSIDDENSRIARATFECNYWGSKFNKKIEVIFTDDEALFGDQRAEVSFKSRGIWVGSTKGVNYGVPAVDLLKLQIYMERMKQRQETSSHRLALRLPWSMHVRLSIGSLIKLTDDRLPSHTNESSLSSVYFEIISTNIDPENGEFTAEVEAVSQGTLFAPSAEVLSYNAGTKEITVDTGGSLGDGMLYSDNPANTFPLPARVRIWRASTDYETYEDNLLDMSSTVDYIVLKDTIAVAPAAGDIVTILDGDDTGNLNDVGADVQDFAFGGNINLQIGTGSYLRSSSRWG